MGAEYPPEVRAAVLAELATGSSISAAARQHGVSRRTVQQWRDSANLPGARSEVQERRDAVGEQLFAYLQASIVALESQVRLFADRSWLEKQSAGELAVLHGVISDKTVRLLQALEPVSEPDAEPSTPNTIDVS